MSKSPAGLVPRYLVRWEVRSADPFLENEVTYHGPFEDRLDALRWAEAEDPTWPDGTTWRTEVLWGRPRQS